MSDADSELSEREDGAIEKESPIHKPKMKQKEIFIESEGDEWLKRNFNASRSRELPGSDSLLEEIIKYSPSLGAGNKILEIGCSDGTRLNWLKEHYHCDCFGLEPSAQAVEAAKSRGLVVFQGTADSLPFDDGEFDIVIFGFCLYLCDRDDLFRIACEADRVLKNPGWLLIKDFYNPIPTKRKYQHRPGLFSYKMDYRTLFTWNPGYTCFSHKVHHHLESGYTDDAQEWVATSVLRKNLERGE